MSEIKGCMNCGNISCGNNKKRESAGCGRYISPEDKIKELEKENAELKEKFLKIKKDDVRKSKLESFKTFEEKNEYLRQVANYAIFNEDISVMLWCFTQRDNIYKDRIAELKGRNAELKGMYAHSAREAGTYKQFLELKEKENAELKKKYVKNITDCDICDTYCNSQLIKAKELLKQWLQISKTSSCDNINIVTDTEQFLNSEVVK